MGITYPISIQDFTIKPQIIGKGGNSVVYSCKNEKYVSKKISFQSHTWVELYLMSSPNIQCPYLMRGIPKIFKDGIYIFEEKALSDLKQSPLLPIFETMRQIVTGVAYLHGKGFIHSDLKPSNILVFEDLIKVNDFGLSTKYEWRHKAKTGSAKYRAPETDKEGWTEKVDCWGLGHILYFLLTGSDLFGDNYREEIKNFKGLNKTDGILWSLCARMLEPEVEKRITLEEICNFFKVSFIPYVQEDKNKEEILYNNLKQKDKRSNRFLKQLANEIIYREESSNYIEKMNIYIDILDKIIF